MVSLLKTEAEEPHTEWKWETTREKGGREIYFVTLSETCMLSRLCVDKQQKEVTLLSIQPHTSYGVGERALWRLFDCATMPALLHFLQHFHAVQPLPYSAARLFILR